MLSYRRLYLYWFYDRDDDFEFYGHTHNNNNKNNNNNNQLLQNNFNKPVVKKVVLKISLASEKKIFAKLYFGISTVLDMTSIA
jgi:hypothetical protein